MDYRATVSSGFNDVSVLALAIDTGQSACVGRPWRLQDTDDPVDASRAVSLLRARLRKGQHETWFESETGELLAVVTNGERAMVMLLRGPGDAGEHAIDDAADGSASTGYVLANGQVDTYADRDTVPFDAAAELVSCVIDGRDRSPSDWQIDR
jgi:hypothetical protein